MAKPRSGSGDGGASRSRSVARVVEAILEQNRFVTDRADRLFRYNGAFWEEFTAAQLRALMLKYDGVGSTTDRRRREIATIIRGWSYYEGLQWGRVKDNEVAARNGVLDVTSGKFRPHNPDDFLERVLPWDYSPGALCPLWQASLERWLGGAVDVIAGMQEFFGYAILSHARFKKALVLEGPTNAGKSAVVHVLRELVGLPHCCSLSVDFMDDPTMRAVLLGKALNLVSELTTDAMIADGGFRMLVSTEEGVLINQKYVEPFLYVPTAKHVFAMNELPPVNDRSMATIERLLIVRMRRPLAEAEIESGFEKRLIEECRGVLLWAIEGARRLIEQGGRFTQSADAASRIAELRGEANPIVAFLGECCRPDPTSAVPLALLTTYFNQWNQGSRKAGTRDVGKMLRQAGKSIKSVRHGGRTANSLVGHLIEYQALPERFEIAEADAAGADPVIDAKSPRRPRRR